MNRFLYQITQVEVTNTIILILVNMSQDYFVYSVLNGIEIIETKPYNI